MIMSLKSLSIISAAFSLLCSLATVSAQNIPSEEAGLVNTVEEFFTTWLVKRDAKSATKYISSTPVIGKCAAPDELDNQDQLPRKVIVDVFQRLFTSSLSAVPQKQQLSDLIKAPGYISSKDRNVVIIDHATNPYFEIFRLNVKAKGEDIRYICKFDERKSFREAVTRLDIYYVVTEVKTTKSENDVELEFLWVKEGNSWRILTIAAPEY